MDFDWTKEQKELKADAIAFAKKTNQGNTIENDKKSIFPRELWNKYAAYGAMRLIAPEKYEGLNLDLLSTVAVMEGFGYGAEDKGLLFSINAHLWSCVEPIIVFGTDAQKEKYLPALCKGEKIGVHAITEADAGSDVFNLKTKCIDAGDCYVLNGSKMFITNGTVADIVLVFAYLKTETGDLLSCFIVEDGTPGFIKSHQIEKMGLRTSPFAELTFVDCRIPKENILGAGIKGDVIFSHTIDAERACILATQLGVMEQQLERCKEYALTRKQFNKPIYENQSISNMLADMKLNLEASRLLVYKVAWERMKGKQTHLDSALAKLHTSEAVIKNSMSAMRIHGAYGYTVEYEIERELRDALGSPIYSGTNEIMRNIIAELIL